MGYRGGGAKPGARCAVGRIYPLCDPPREGPEPCALSKSQVPSNSDGFPGSKSQTYPIWGMKPKRA